MDNRFECKCGQKVWFLCDNDRYVKCVACGQCYKICRVEGDKIFLFEKPPPGKGEDEKTEGGEKE